MPTGRTSKSQQDEHPRAFMFRCTLQPRVQSVVEMLRIFSHNMLHVLYRSSYRMSFLPGGCTR